MGDEFSIAWRVLDAQFWGVPQRRRRIFLVADFRGQCAGEILFEREGLSRSFTESRKAWKGITHSLACGSDAKVWDARGNGDGRTCSTITGDHENRITDYTNLLITGIDCFGKGTRPHSKEEAQKWEEAVIANCLNVNDIGESRASEIFVMTTQQGGAEIGIDLCPTITAAAGMSGNNQPVICYALDRSSFNQGINAQYDIGIDDSGIAQTLVAKGPGAIAYGVPLGFRAENTYLYQDTGTTICNGTNPGHHKGVLIIDKLHTEVRRLTPTECGRLQGMPDWWCKDVPHSDSAEYKMWGNGMALPCVLYVMENVVSVLSLRLLDSLFEVSG